MMAALPLQALFAWQRYRMILLGFGNLIRRVATIKELTVSPTRSFDQISRPGTGVRSK